MLEEMKKIGAGIADLKVEAGGVAQIPPASLQQFLKAKNDLPGVVIAEHQVSDFSSLLLLLFLIIFFFFFFSIPHISKVIIYQIAGRVRQQVLQQLFRHVGQNPRQRETRR